MAKMRFGAGARRMKGIQRTEQALHAVHEQRRAGGGINPSGLPARPTRSTPPKLDFKTKLKHPKPSGLY